jgi:hypothetical protein
MHMRAFVIALAAGAAVSAASAQQVVIGVDSTARVAHLFDANDGSVVQLNFLDWDLLTDGSSATSLSTASEALQVGDQIWVSDQLRDVIYRFNLDGTHIANIPNTGLDNIKGMEVVGDQVWVTNAGSNNGASGNSIVFIDIATASIVGSVATNGSLFDLINFNGQLMGSNITTEDLELYDLSGNLSGVFHSSDGISSIDFPQQMFVKNDGNVLVGGFSSPSGVFEFDSSGNSLGVILGSGVSARGVLQLGNGEVMWTSSAGFYIGESLVLAGSGRYLNFLDLDSTECVGDIADDFGTLGADGQVSFGDFLALLGLIGRALAATPAVPAISPMTSVLWAAMVRSASATSWLCWV